MRSGMVKVVRWRVEQAGHAALTGARRRGYLLQRPLVRLDRVYDTATSDAIRAVAPRTMTTPAGVAALRDAVAYVVDRGLDGAIVECGVWRGGSMMAAAHRLRELAAADRELWLYDTYGGMTAPGPFDVTVSGREAAAWIAAERTTADDVPSGVFGAPVSDVRRNLESTGYPPDRLHFVVGPVEQTLIDLRLPDAIAVLRLDTDFYQSTLIELRQLYPLLVPGGVLILDDYGYWQGARRAVDEYFSGQRPLLMRIDGSARLVIKQ